MMVRMRRAAKESPYLAEVSEEDIERLASRLAMLVSDEGEAENAARAVNHLARKVGMTGGQLKEMFLIGASGRPASSASRPRPGEVDRLERELATLRRSLQKQQTDLNNAERERDTLHVELEQLRGALFKVHATSHAQRIIGAIVLVAVIVAAGVGYVVPNRAPAPARIVQAPPAEDPTAGDQKPAPTRFATVRNARTYVHRDPDPGSPVIASLTPGSSVVVHRLLWNMLMQWAEVEVASGIGYVLTTDIDMS
jgi:hypothetical protein